ncbi:hypothetical protein KGP36_02705 [Patescibacteria group bacterium]|nr:hypothetical protein [Patescibacteria group bacterium]
MTKLTTEQTWNLCRGMSWPWDYCASGTAVANAPGLKEWVERSGEYTVSLRDCARVAAQIRRGARMEIGNGLGQCTLS